MKEKIVFFILGVIVTSISFYTGKTSEADRRYTELDKLQVKEIQVTEKFVIAPENVGRNDAIMTITASEKQVRLIAGVEDKMTGMMITPKELNIGLIGNINKPENSTILLTVTDRHAEMFMESIMGKTKISPNDIDMD